MSNTSQAIENAFSNSELSDYVPDTSQLTCVNYGTKLMSYYKDVSFSTDFRSAHSVSRIGNDTYVCRDHVVDKFAGYKMLPCLVHLIDTKGYDIRSLMQSYDSKILASTLSGVCIYDDYFMQGREFKADALSKFLSSSAS